MTLTSVGIVCAVATLLGTLSGFVVALRRSASDSENNWHDIMNAQLNALGDRNTELERKISDLWSMLDLERAERRRIEGAMATRISLLESILRQNGIALPS